MDKNERVHIYCDYFSPGIDIQNNNVSFNMLNVTDITDLDIADMEISDPWYPGPLFTKRSGVLPQDLLTSRSREIRV